jgi:hypothetical protein
MSPISRLAAAPLALAIVVAAPAACLAEQRPDLAYAISKLLATDPTDPGNGTAFENNEDKRYHHSITVEFTGKYGDSVETQVRTTAEVALRVGYLVLKEGYKPPGPDLIIKMACRNLTLGLPTRSRCATDGPTFSLRPRSMRASPIWPPRAR